MNKKMSEFLGTLMLVSAVVAMLLLLWYSLYNESQVYNRLTCSNTTAWDALWVELRVDGSSRKCDE